MRTYPLVPGAAVLLMMALMSGCPFRETTEFGTGGGAQGQGGVDAGPTTWCTTVAQCDVPGPCAKVECKAGACVYDVADMAKPDDGNPCTEESCKGTELQSTFSAAGTPCMATGSKVCDGAGSCVACVSDTDCAGPGVMPTCDVTTNTCISCSDGIQNGMEAGQDCGGSCPTKCGDQPCMMASDCQSGACAEGFCCGTACTAECFACNVPGKVGTCTPVPKGLEDDTCMGASSACNGVGACAMNVTGNSGALCSTDAQCYTGACGDGVCRLPIGAPCSTSEACATLNCVGHVCAACSTGADCTSSICTDSHCKAGGGSLCGSDADCAGGNCDGIRHLCGKSTGSPCAGDNDCSTYFCAMSTCAGCTVGSDCKSGSCTMGNCDLPSGAYCTPGAPCKLGLTCKGFPATCRQ